MHVRLTPAMAFGLLAAGTLHADFTYEETSKVTGGAIVSMMKFAGAFSKDARRANEPTTSTVAIKGNRLARKSQLTGSVIDLDAETITTINFEKKTYFTMTFAQMKEAMDNAMKQMNQSKDPDAPDMQFDIKLNDTGQTRNINGIATHEVIVTMTMQGTDQKSGAKGGLNVVTDSWLAPKVAGYDEVREFYRRMATKMNWVPGAGGMFNRPDIARGMSEVYKEGAKMDGIPVMQLVKMGGTVENAPQNSDGSQSQSQPQSTSSSSSSSSSSSPPPTSVGSAIGSALGGRFGLGRKRNQSQDQSSNSTSGQQGSGNNGNASGSLMEMTIELTNYSALPADPALFAVPAGFRQVEPETNPRRSR